MIRYKRRVLSKEGFNLPRIEEEIEFLLSPIPDADMQSRLEAMRGRISCLDIRYDALSYILKG